MDDDAGPLVASDGALPFAAPLSHEVFTSAGFDTSAFLLSHRHTPLDDLRAELRAYLAKLREELVGVINHDYEDFIGLAIGLKGTDDKIKRMNAPVQSIEAQIRSTKDSLAIIQTAILDQLAARSAVRQQKATLRLLLSINDSVAKVENLLHIPPPESSKSLSAETMRKRSSTLTLQTPAMTKSISQNALAMESPTKRIERIAAEYNQMLHLVSKGKDLPLVANLQPRIDHIRRNLQRELSSLLSNTLHHQVPRPQQPVQEEKAYREALLECLRTFSSIGNVPEAEQIIRKETIRDFMSRTIVRDAVIPAQSPMSPHKTPVSSSPMRTSSRNGTAFLLSPSKSHNPVLTPILPLEHPVSPFYAIEPISPSKSSPDDPLIDLYNTLLNFISHNCSTLLEITDKRLASAPTDGTSTPRAGQHSKSEFNVLANVIWDEIGTRLMTELGNVIFAAGRPDVFHQHYVATSTFVSRIEKLCASNRQLQALRNHPTYVAFHKRWQLPVYFQLRFKEIAGRLESYLDSRDASAVRPSTKANEAESFFMPATEAAHRAVWSCWQENVVVDELVHRFWRLSLQIVSRYKTWLDNAVTHYIQPLDKDGLSSSTASRSNTRPGTPSEDGNDENALRQLSVIISDTSRLHNRTMLLYDEEIVPNLERITQNFDEDADPRVAMDETLAGITALHPTLSSQIVTILIKRCAEPLRLVRTSLSQVKVDAAHVDTSYFIPNILAPLKSYIESYGRAVSQESISTWAKEVFDEVANRYASGLSVMKKNEDSLRKLKKGRSNFTSLFSSSSSAAAPTDQSNIVTPEDQAKARQLYVDIEAFGQDATALGIDIRKSEAFRSLKFMAETWCERK